MPKDEAQLEQDQDSAEEGQLTLFEFQAERRAVEVAGRFGFPPSAVADIRPVQQNWQGNAQFWSRG